MIDHLNKKKGINIFGNRADNAVMKDLHKIHDMKNYEPMDAPTVTYLERKIALVLLIFFKKKRNRDIKARDVAVVSNQRT